MNNELQVFNSSEFGNVRVVQVDGEPWFVAADVCRALKISNSRDAVARLDDDEKGIGSTDTLGGKQGMQIINEPGLYTLVLGSRKPEAKTFKRWVTHEVLPAIRKTGGYKTPKQSSDRDKAMLKNAQARSAKLWLEIAKNTGIQTYKDVCNAYAARNLQEKMSFRSQRCRKRATPQPTLARCWVYLKAGLEHWQTRTT